MAITRLKIQSGQVASSVGGGAKIYSVKDYGAKGDANWVFDAGITSSSTTLTSASASFSLLDVGKKILVVGAGASGAGLITTISAYISPTQITLANAASTTVSNKEIFWGTDDTVAIQNAINACFSAGGGTIYAPNGIYLIGGALQTSVNGVNPNCQIYIPTQALGDTTRCTIRIKGESTHHHVAGYSTLSPALIKTGTLLRSIITGSGLNPSVIGSKGLPANYQNYNYTSCIIEDLLIRTYTNGGALPASVSGTNFLYGAKFSAKRLNVGIDCRFVVSSNPTASETFGIAVSHINDDGPNVLEECVVGGYKYGYVPNEHTVLINTHAFCCNYAYAFNNNYYVVKGINILAVACNYAFHFPAAILGITATSNKVFIDIQCEVEEDVFGHWYDTVGMVSDTNNIGFGTIKYQNVIAGGTVKNSGITHIGARNLNLIPIDSVLSKRSNTSGGRVSLNAGVDNGTTDDNAVLEIGSPTTTSTDNNFSVIAQSTNQTGTANVLASRTVLNKALGALAANDKRMFHEVVFTDGTTSNAKYAVYQRFTNVFTQVLERTKTYLKFMAVPVMMPQWTTASRPTPPSAGMEGYNTTDNKKEYWNGTTWIQL